MPRLLDRQKKDLLGLFQTSSDDLDVAEDDGDVGEALGDVEVAYGLGFGLDVGVGDELSVFSPRDFFFLIGRDFFVFPSSTENRDRTKFSLLQTDFPSILGRPLAGLPRLDSSCRSNAKRSVVVLVGLLLGLDG